MGVGNRPIDALAERLAGLEVRGVPGGQRYRRSGPRVARLPRGSATQREGAEAADLDASARGETCRRVFEHDVLEHDVDRELDVSGTLKCSRRKCATT